MGDDSFVAVDFQDLGNHLKIGDHIIVDFGAVCMKVIGYEKETDFLISKQLEGADVIILYYFILYRLNHQYFRLSQVKIQSAFKVKN